MREKLLKEYCEKMRDCESGDIESDHIDADELLCNLLIKLGYEEVVIIYRQIKKWYA